MVSGVRFTSAQLVRANVANHGRVLAGDWCRGVNRLAHPEIDGSLRRVLAMRSFPGVTRAVQPLNASTIESRREDFARPGLGFANRHIRTPQARPRLAPWLRYGALALAGWEKTLKRALRAGSSCQQLPILGLLLAIGFYCLGLR